MWLFGLLGGMDSGATEEAVMLQVQSYTPDPKPRSKPYPRSKPSVLLWRQLCSTSNPKPYDLNPTPYTLHPTPYTLNPKPYTLHPTPYTLHPTPYTLHPTPYGIIPDLKH